MYGSDVWALRKVHKRKMRAVLMRFIRRTTRVTLQLLTDKQKPKDTRNNQYNIELYQIEQYRKNCEFKYARQRNIVS